MSRWIFGCQVFFLIGQIVATLSGQRRVKRERLCFVECREGKMEGTQERCKNSKLKEERKDGPESKAVMKEDWN